MPSARTCLRASPPRRWSSRLSTRSCAALMGGTESASSTSARSRPRVVMLVGLQGAGKTTNGAKLAALMRKSQNKRPLLVACDVYRPAAIEQLKVVGEKLGSSRYTRMGQGDPVEIAKHAIDHARQPRKRSSYSSIPPDGSTSTRRSWTSCAASRPRPNRRRFCSSWTR